MFFFLIEPAQLEQYFSGWISILPEPVIGPVRNPLTKQMMTIAQWQNGPRIGAAAFVPHPDLEPLPNFTSPWNSGAIDDLYCALFDVGYDEAQLRMNKPLALPGLADDYGAIELPEELVRGFSNLTDDELAALVAKVFGDRPSVEEHQVALVELRALAKQAQVTGAKLCYWWP